MHMVSMPCQSIPWLTQGNFLSRHLSLMSCQSLHQSQIEQAQRTAQMEALQVQQVPFAILSLATQHIQCLGGVPERNEYNFYKHLTRICPLTVWFLSILYMSYISYWYSMDTLPCYGNICTLGFTKPHHVPYVQPKSPARFWWVGCMVAGWGGGCQGW